MPDLSICLRLFPILAAAFLLVCTPSRKNLDNVYRGVLTTNLRHPTLPGFRRPGDHGRRQGLYKAADFIYSIKRMCDARTQTTGWWIFDGKVVGLEDFRKASEGLPPLPKSAG